MEDYYKILKIEKDASQDEIKKAYKKRAVETHPDKNNGSKDSEEEFKMVNQAYETLSDEQKRKDYDMFGSNGGQRFQGHGFDMSDIFSQFGDIFGGFNQHYRTKRGQDLRVQVQVNLNDVIFGSSKKIKYNRNDKCSTCDGKGGTDPRDCTSCNGSGKRIMIQQTPFGRIQQETPCNSCSGSGKKVSNKCTSCSGAGVKAKEEIIDINIPAGVSDGMNLTMSGHGNHILDGAPGDLQIIISEVKHPKFNRQGNDLHCEEWISIPDAVLGTKINLDTLHGKMSFDISPGTDSGKVITAKGKGVPNLAPNGHTYGSGDLHIKVSVRIPKKLTDEEKQTFEALKAYNL